MTTPHGPIGVPLPGQHLPGQQTHELVDPEHVRIEVDELLSGLAGGSGSIAHRARILEEAHEVLVRALGSVDKI